MCYILWFVLRYMDDDENVHRIACRFVPGETVEFFKRRWIPVTVVSIHNLITDEYIHKARSESFERAPGGFDLYVQVRSAMNIYNVLQDSKRLVRTGTHIRRGDPEYDRMLEMMRHEPRRVKQIRRERELRRLTAVHAFDTAMRRVAPHKGTLALRAHFSQFVKKIPIDNKNIK